jgi:CMP-N,N'-diacetyllegionaminic acid synthase
MRILALIPARGGSKRLAGKNIRILGNKPLIHWSIDVAKGIPEICDILVSTDDAEIAATSKEVGALVPWLRPAELATDVAGSVEVALHALDWYEAEMGVLDGLLLLQPTSPFRSKESIRKGIKLFEKHAKRTVLGVSPTSSHPMWTLKVENGFLVPYMQNSGLKMRSQDLPEAYVVNGCMYLISPAELRSCRSFAGAPSIPLLIESPREALDIDTEWDFFVAEVVANSIHEK